MLDSFDQALRAMGELRLRQHDDEDIRPIVETVSAKFERFMKSAVWPQIKPRTKLHTCIEDLKQCNVPQGDISNLHGLRDLYNTAKHDPQQRLKLSESHATLVLARAAVASLVGTSVGLTGASASVVANSLLWVTGHDVYTHGVTEVYVSLPLKDRFATHVDMVWIQGKDWDALINDLNGSSCFQYGEGAFDAATFKHFVEGDFINAGVWEGDYRELVRILAKYEDRETNTDVLQGLRRESNSVSVLSSVALAGRDVANGATAALPVGLLTTSILDRADSVYAMPKSAQGVQRAATDLAALLTQLSISEWGQLVGPYWNLWKPRQLVARIESNDRAVRFTVDDRYRIVVN